MVLEKFPYHTKLGTYSTTYAAPSPQVVGARGVAKSIARLHIRTVLDNFSSSLLLIVSTSSCRLG